jgi:hypothetical protein
MQHKSWCYSKSGGKPHFGVTEFRYKKLELGVGSWEFGKSYIDLTTPHTFNNYGVAEYKYDKRLFLSLEPVVGAIHELPLPQVSYINSAMPQLLARSFLLFVIESPHSSYHQSSPPRTVRVSAHR